jgi:malonyl-CoA/methylmalonyl-CoA synthetase
LNANLYTAFGFDSAKSSTVALETDAGTALTYGDMHRLSARLAHVVRSRGVGPGDRVVMQVAKSPEMLLLYLAVVRVGGVIVPLNTGYTLAELGYLLRDAEPALVVCAPAQADSVRALLREQETSAAVETLDGQAGGTLMQAAQHAPSSIADEDRRSDDLAAILYTSGTTGRSKGAMLTHANLVSNARTLVDFWQITDRDVLLHALPLYHTHGLFVACNTALIAGARMLFKSSFDCGEIVRALPRATLMMGVPTFYTRLLQDPRFDAALCAHMRLFTSGSAPLLAATHDEFKCRTGHLILERYGMTETNMITSNPYDGDRIAGTVGMPLPGVQVRIADPDTAVVLGRNEIGVIEVKGPNVFPGYWRMPEKTREEFRSDGYFITGDLGSIDERGYVRIVGRTKDLIISGGFNVYPKEVEIEIDAVPGVLESAVIGCPHADFGEGVTAVVVVDGSVPIDSGTILRALESRLARFKQPKRIVFADCLPRNAMGKVQKNVLRAEHAHLYDA